MTTRATTSPANMRGAATIRPGLDPQPAAPQIRPGATDVGVKHLHDGVMHRPTHQQIERRAYEIWLRRGKVEGNAAVDWLQAERELTTEINGRNAD